MDYYKILKESECHNNLQYKFGLNNDILEFNPSGNCKPGGIYFSREDIFAFLDYGVWIRKVTLPEDAQIYENPGTPKKWKADKVILGKKEKMTAKVIKRLINEGANPKIKNSYPLRWAAEKGYTEIVKLLIPVSNPKAYNIALQCAAEKGYTKIVKLLIPVSDLKTCNNYTLQCAAEYGHLEIVKLLLSVLDPKEYNSYALRLAAYNGHIEVVKILIPVSDPKACNSYALRLAAQHGYTEIVKRLIPVSDPKALNSYALRFAAEKGHTEVVKLLLPVSDPKAQNNYALRYAIEKNHTDIINLLIPVSEINDKVIDYCKAYCKDQKIYDLIISNKPI